MIICFFWSCSSSWINRRLGGKEVEGVVVVEGVVGVKDEEIEESHTLGLTGEVDRGERRGCKCYSADTHT